MARAWVAKWPGYCSICNNRIKVDVDRIGRLSDDRASSDYKRYAHETCLKMGVPRQFAATVAVPPLDALDSDGQPIWTPQHVTRARTPAPAPAPVLNAADLDAALDYMRGDGPDADLLAPAKPAPAPAEFTPSRFQVAVFDHVLNPLNLSLMVGAVAGSGKSTTQKHTIRKLPRSATFVYSPFNRDIAAAFRAALPEFKEDIRTTHSLGLLNLTDHLNKGGRRVQVKEGRLFDILDSIWPKLSYHAPDDEKAKWREKRAAMLKLVDLAKGTLVDENDPAAVLAMADFYSADLGDFEVELLDALPKVLKLCADDPYTVDFADMLWLPIRLNLKLRQYDYFLGDEVQDYAPVQVELCMRSIEAGGRAVMVGDQNQSLYLFRGADSNAMARLQTALGADELPLSICYRCPTSHVALAQQYVPEIEARPNAPEGTITHMQARDLAAWVQPGDMLICRTNAPLVPVAFRLIARGVKAVVKGREIGKSLADLADKYAKLSATLPELLDHLTEWARREDAKLERRNAPEAARQLVWDKVEVLQIVADQPDVREPAQVGAKITTLFDEKHPQVTLSTIHKAKGLEADRVGILRPDLLPLPAVMKNGRAHEVQAEMNACYVAKTRAKDVLAFVEQDDDTD